MSGGVSLSLVLPHLPCDGEASQLTLPTWTYLFLFAFFLSFGKVERTVAFLILFLYFFRVYDVSELLIGVNQLRN